MSVHFEHEHHVSPIWQLAAVLAVLLILTFITVAVTWIDLGGLNIWVALAVAVVKAAFVGLYFMHLRYDAPFNAVILIASLVFVSLFIGFSLIDTAAYQDQFEQPVISSDAAGG